MLFMMADRVHISHSEIIHFNIIIKIVIFLCPASILNHLEKNNLISSCSHYNVIVSLSHTLRHAYTQTLTLQKERKEKKKETQSIAAFVQVTRITGVKHVICVVFQSWIFIQHSIIVYLEQSGAEPQSQTHASFSRSVPAACHVWSV